jgi:hypothetical protein
VRASVSPTNSGSTPASSYAATLAQTSSGVPTVIDGLLLGPGFYRRPLSRRPVIEGFTERVVDIFSAALNH